MTVPTARSALLRRAAGFVTLSSVLSCSSKSHPPIISTSGPKCAPPGCAPSVPRAAFAVEATPAVEGGTCASPVSPLSLPQGDAALRAIISCGGNQVRCGDMDYRTGDGDRDAVSCTKTGGDTVHLTAHASSGGDSVDVEGDTSVDGATLMITVTNSAGKKILDGARCTAVTEYAFSAAVYAKFTCDLPSAGRAGCSVRGTLVFEGCHSGCGRSAVGERGRSG